MPYYNGGQAVATDDVLAIEAEARAPLEAERDLWKRDWGIKNDQWEKAIEARAEPRAAPLDVERLRAAVDAALFDAEMDDSHPGCRAKWRRVAMGAFDAAALEEPTDD